MRLLKSQQAVAKENLDRRIYLDGVAGTGKTTAAIERIKELIREGVPAEQIMVLVPQAALAIPYREALRRSRLKTGSNIRTSTLGRLAFELVDLFWPLVAEESGVANPYERPHFLTLEMVQYTMRRFIGPAIEERDYFNSVHIDRSRLYTQIVDNLNKAAVVDFPYQQITERLVSALPPDGGKRTEKIAIYADAQAAADLFRQQCLRTNLLDFSLQVELFTQRLWHMDAPRRYLTRQVRHLIVDNIEEDTPVTHDLLREWVMACDSAVLIYDDDGGYRRFLGADPTSARTLRDLCDVHITLDNHRVMSADVEGLQVELARTLNRAGDAQLPKNSDPRAAFVVPDSDTDTRFHHQMIDWAVAEIKRLIDDEGVTPSEIVVLAAYLPDSMRYALQSRLDAAGIAHRSHRPSRALRDEPAARCLLTLARLAHPLWDRLPPAFDVTAALTFAIEGLDLVRARLLTEMLYRDGLLHRFDTIRDVNTQARITFALGEPYGRLVQWLHDYKSTEEPIPLDAFFSRLFGEVLSQPGFGFHKRTDAATVAANLVDSARQFRQMLNEIEPQRDAAPEYVALIDEGIFGDVYLRDWEFDRRDGVQLLPAYTFLMNNRPVDVQFWLDIGSPGWGQRVYQPLTQPYVLSRQWQQGAIWTEEDEHSVNQDALYALVMGLLRRCRRQVYLGFSQYGEQGYDQRGPLLMTVQRLLRRLARDLPHVG